MAVGGLSGNTSSSLGLYGAGTKGYGGLASGLDTESLIEGMTIGTRTKIQKFQSQNQKYQWQTNAYRGISDMLVKFSNKYLDLTSANSPMRSSFFNKSLVALGGANSKFLSVSGASSALDNMQILGIQQLAKDTSAVTNSDASNQIINTGSFAFGQDVEESKLNGGYLKISYNNKDYTINMREGDVLDALKGKPGFTDGKADYSTVDKAIESFNAQLAATDIGGGKNLGQIMQMGVDGSGQFTLSTISADAGEPVLKGGSSEQMKLLGFVDADGKVFDEGKITTAGYVGKEALADTDMITKTLFEKYLDGKELRFEYNGVSKAIKMPSEAILNAADSSGNVDQLANFKQYLDEELGKAFGRNKVEIDVTTGGGLSFKTSEGSSVLKITGGSTGLLGEGGALGMTAGVSNRLGLTTSLKDSSFFSSAMVDATGEVQMEINGVKIKGLTENSSMKQVMEAINNSEAGVKVNYLETADRFSLTSTIKGASGKIEMTSSSHDLAKELFGNSTVIDGTDAIMRVKYDGNAEMTIVRDTNSFNLEGATFNLTGTFGFDTSGNYIQGTEAVGFTTSMDTDKITKVIADMVKDYNDLVDAVTKENGTRPDKKYPPLTEEQKKEMSKDDIEKWEEKAKQGVLYNDNLLGSLTNKLRVVFSGAVDMGVLKDMGLDMGNSYSGNGKITFDEEKFKNKLQEDPDQVKEMFQREATTSDGGGFLARLKSITDEFAKTTGSRKGLLIEKAGSEHAATSLVQNSLKTLMEEGQKTIDSFKVKLQNEIDRYSKEFTALEKLVAQMNSQSSYLSSLSF